MKKIYLFLALLLAGSLTAQTNYVRPSNAFAVYFNEAYALYPSIPKGILEAVAYTNTHLTMLDGSEPESCMGLPRAYGVMGLIEDGKGYFRNNLPALAQTSGFSPDQLKTNPRAGILAYAAAFAAAQISNRAEDQIPVLRALSELPDGILSNNDVQYYANISFQYEVFSFLNNPLYATEYGFPVYQINLQTLFGQTDYALLHQGTLRIAGQTGLLVDEDGNRLETGRNNQRNENNDPNVQSPDYGPALWNQAASCNYSSRGTATISAVTIHTVQGSYAGCISWFQNCAAGVSAHYVVRSSDGQVTQMVYESLKAWHVGTENPYTVGIEHEGYVNNASWYTTAMYTASAALTKNICQDNNIDPLRTGWYPWLATTYYNQSGIPGSCTKVKGHQHYPNQTHNDPGVNWNWNYFYTLINAPAPAPTLYTTATGTLYDSGGNAGNYSDDERITWTIQPTNATSVTLNFSAFATENTWDYLFIYDGANTAAPLIGYYTGTTSPGTITSSGGALTLEFRSDCATQASGWAATWSSVVNNPNTDVTAPTTTVSVTGTWQTTNFNANFTDADNNGGSGLEKSFYQIIDFDGTDWRANNMRGFFSDNFDLPAISPEWTSVSGVWATNNSVLEQSDEANGNTNIYAPLTQNLSNKYLYHWAGKIDGTQNNRRAGIHFFCDNGALTNRGNSYFVWFRVDQSVCEFYEVVNDVFTLQHSVPMTTAAGQWYDWKVVYDRTTGKIEVFQNNLFIGTWTDNTPLSTGAYVSFRSGNCNWQINNFKVYRSRTSNAPVSVQVGSCPTCEIRFQNTNPATPSGRVKSIVRDSANNFSAISYYDVNVDWTVPSAVDTINDGLSADSDLTTSANTLSANWSTATDTHSGLSRYWYAIGTTAGDSNVVSWTSNWGYDTVVVTNLPLVSNQWYYFSVRAENGAGLITTTYISDGILVDLSLDLTTPETSYNVQVWPNPFDASTVLTYVLPQPETVRITLTDASGRLIYAMENKQQAGAQLLDLGNKFPDLANGVYFLNFEAGNQTTRTKLVRR
jgi:N-acetyl-anhydromuramyl-L-alanine amidase AmpD